MIYCQTGYTRDIPWIFLLYTRHIPGKGHLRACFVPISTWKPWTSLWSSQFLATEAAHARLGPYKVPQPGVDLINMAAPPPGRACTIGTKAPKSVPLSANVLMWNSWGCIFIQKAWNERDSAKEVVNPSDIECGNRWGLVYPVNCFLFHDSRNPQAKFLKGTEENQVELNVFIRTVEAARHFTYAQCTAEEQLGKHKYHTQAVQIK